MNYLTPEQVLFIHSRLVAETGGSHGVRDLGLLESAVARPQATFDGKDLYPDLFTKAAALMDSFINNHPFVDGNKRTGVTAAGLFLQINGWRLTTSPEDLEAFILHVATAGMEVASALTGLALPDTLRGLSHSAPGGVFGEVVTDTKSKFQNEERLVAELEQLGVRYLSRQTSERTIHNRLPHQLLADLVRQPSSRVRAALIALLLAQPSFAKYVPAALKSLPPEQVITLKLFYTAAVLLQHQYAASLQTFLGADWSRLPDLFSAEFNLPATASRQQLRVLAKLHQQKTGMILNWAGTYENAARHLLRRWELEQTWNL
jgi:death-on-curing protein